MYGVGTLARWPPSGKSQRAGVPAPRERKIDYLVRSYL